MKGFEGGKKKWKNYDIGKYRKERRNSNKKIFQKDEHNINSNKNNKKYQKIIPIHCFECFFTPYLKIIMPEIIDDNSKIKIKYKCPNEHKKVFELQEFLEITQKHSFTNVKCSICKSNNISELSYCKINKSFRCLKCASSSSQFYWIPFKDLDSTCMNHTYANQTNAAPKKEIKVNKVDKNI